jgi:ubiquitin
VAQTLERSMMQIIISDLCGRETTLQVASSDTIKAVKDKYQEKAGSPPDEQRLIYMRQELEDNRTLRDYGIPDQSVVHHVRVLRGGKPVIYISSPTTVHAQVSLQLKPAWSFSAIYPTTKIKSEEDGGQEILWDVMVKPNGILTDVASGSEISYLYWEAK